MYYICIPIPHYGSLDDHHGAKGDARRRWAMRLFPILLLSVPSFNPSHSFTPIVSGPVGHPSMLTKALGCVVSSGCQLLSPLRAAPCGARTLQEPSVGT